ncbi:MAG: uncharacterized protein QG588_1038 [Candidatus Poribacteria bacterium]|nr:uncharacterized protein [Candidatus Poribacteria bacterium]
MRLHQIVREDVLEHIEQKHNIQEHEVYEIFDNYPYIRRIEKGERPGEDIYSAFGRTNAGRYLIVFFIKKRNGHSLIRSARDMTLTERKRYEQT